MEVLITIPHSYCKNKFKRDCDTLSLKVAKALANSLLSENLNIKIHAPISKNEFGDKLLEKYLISNSLKNILRKTCDMNRSWCRNTEYRKVLTNYLKKNHKNIIFHFDVHSFPFGYKKKNIKLYFIDGSNYSNYTEKLAEYIVKNIKSNIIIHRGPKSCKKDVCYRGTNDILDEVRNFGIKSVLVEFLETMENKDYKIYCNIIAKWVKMKYG